MVSTSNGIVATYKQRNQRRPTIPELLMSRQQYGLNARNSSNQVTVTQLASRIAWNPSRMRNMTLCVGPGTPAAVCMVRTSSDGSSSSDDDGDDDDDDDSAEMRQVQQQQQHNSDDSSSDAGDDSSEFDDDHVLHHQDDEDEQEENDDELQDNDEEHSDDDDDDSAWLQQRRRQENSRSLEQGERNFMDWMDSGDDEDSSEEDEDDDHHHMMMNRHHNGNNNNNSNADEQVRSVPSLRHGGCINTATWLTSPWRLSTVGGNSHNSGGYDEYTTVPSDDCPTQLITSGDDRQVKFWDVRHAMGTSNPLAGGKNTVCPFSSEVPRDAPVDAWTNFFQTSVIALSGSVLPLASVYTRHRGNVFHVTPLDEEAGKVVTCGADGFLRCADLTTGTSTTIVSADGADSSSLRPGMCFSHHMVDAHTGLLCSERGLRRFDLRLNPREQQAGSVLTNNDQSCKSCAVWSKGSVESAYVFAGGASPDVALYDLRMVSDGGPPSKMVQLYRPRGLKADAHVSVSGIDISKNRRELLVSYENDQIYSFPICPQSVSAAGPAVDELTALSNALEKEETVQHELCAYGGHLNRYTFLKNAKYAGPNDEYICTGSDSGHAWIYNKYNGSVVSFLNADHSTCNGVVPHPTLPLFVTYGIDSTAKLWRATTPVDSEVDDSPTGRSRFYRENKHYNRTPLVSSWSYCKEKLSILSDVEDDAICVMPDEIPSTADMCDRGLFGGLSSIFFSNRRTSSPGQVGPYIGNDLRNLAGILRQNLFSCILAHESDDDEPVRSSLTELKQRMSVIRLNHQAAQKGLTVDPDIPWQLRAAQWHSQLQIPVTEGSDQRSLVKYGDPVDLIPESPCDWIPYDPRMTGNHLPCGPSFNLDDYEDFYRQFYSGPHAIKVECEENSFVPGGSASAEYLHGNKRKLDTHETVKKLVIVANGDDPNLTLQPVATSIPVTPDTSQRGPLTLMSSMSSDEGIGSVVTPGITPSAGDIDTTRSLKVLHDTVLTLKEAGNTAQKAGLPSLAARRYDQAIQYCAIVFLEFPRGDLDIFAARREEKEVEKKNKSKDKIDHLAAATATSSNLKRLQWSPLLKLLITTRLNLSMVLLKLHHDPEPKKAADLAMTALFELGPFVVQKGQVRKGRKYSEVYSRDEPEATYLAAKELQAKGFFRLGSAQQKMGNHADAIKSFDHSIKSTKAIDGEPELVVLRRLAEVKRVTARKNKTQRKKLKAMFGGGESSAAETTESNITETTGEEDSKTEE